MGLINGSLQIGRSALLAHQAANQVIGNNIANAGNADYTRQTPRLAPLQGSPTSAGPSAGAGVQLSGIERDIDNALEQRLRSAMSDSSRDDFISTTLGRLETLYPDLSSEGLAKNLSDFFGAFATLQTRPQDSSARTVALQTGQALVQQIQTLRKDTIGIYEDVGNSMTETVKQINDLTAQIADLNGQIASARSTGDTGGALLDKRDSLLKQLSQLTDINVIDQNSGQVLVYLDTDPLIQGDQARTLEVRQTPQGDLNIPEIVFADNSRQANVTGGKAGAVSELISTIVDGNLRQLDTLATGLIGEVNKIHASGQGLIGYSDLTSANAIADPNLALNQDGLGVTPQNGSFLIKVKDANTGTETVQQININLSGLGSQTTLTSLAADLNAVGNVQATIQADGRLHIATAADNYTITFSEDSSGVLAALGINSFFTGKGAADIGVNRDLVNDPRLLACGTNNLPGDGANAAAIARLQTQPVSSLNGLSITAYYRSIVGNVGTQSASAKQKLNVHSAIVDTLTSQREAISGVSIDEETINLMSNQQAFQGAAKYVSTVNNMLVTLMQMI